jgi:lysophospholipase L1-like esterase
MRLSLTLFSCLAVFTLWMQGVAPVRANQPPPTQAQPVAKAPFEAEIAAFETADKKTPPPQGAVLFLGSSSIRLWSTLTKDFPELTVLNRGFGGSQISDSIRYADRIVLPYKPKMIVFYAGGNDINAGKSPQQVFQDFQTFVAKVHSALPATRIVYISINPSVARWSQEEKVLEANRLIEDYTKKQNGKTARLSFLDSHSKLLSPEGKPRPEILRQDSLHLNAEGYKLWTAILKPQILALVENKQLKNDTPRRLAAAPLSARQTVRQHHLNSVLLTAVQKGNTKQVVALLRQGADPEIRDTANVPVFLLSGMQGYHDIQYHLDVAGEKWYPPFERWWILNMTGKDARQPLIEGQKLVMTLECMPSETGTDWTDSWKGKTIALQMWWGVTNAVPEWFTHTRMSLESDLVTADVEYEPEVKESQPLGVIDIPVWVIGTVKSMDVPHKVIRLYVNTKGWWGKNE